MTIQIRDATAADQDWVLRTNNEALPDVNALSADDLKDLIEMACYFRVADNDGEPAGFLLAMNAEADYQSPNYQWFKQRYPEFVYIDRVVVARRFRGVGVGRVFYADIQSYAEALVPCLTCEVNLEPPNDVSLLFHGTNGFVEVGQQKVDAKRVSLLMKALPSYEFVQSRYGGG
ncbi:MAG: GNAT family N-acetyltransferase [Xanthomonadales bacterium]|nr:GNAT family N-acetyltransferase [Xanthomonadales bacterium]